ncbi:protein FAM219B isoform X4 [Cygnus olor]|uniref:protein FAM219B isoform X4 n=1 Tax=Cygnus olor TaxID=8869 RepID=UPI001ADE5463|nr:protein FAM219B isoform X4 [Cygnus olor]
MGLGVSTGLCGAIWGYMGLGVRVGLCAWGAVWGWSVFVGQCGALRSRSGIGPERVYGAAWGCTRGAVRVEQHAAVQGCRHQGTGSGRGCVGQRPYRGRASTQGPHSAHRELCRVRPQLSPSPFQPPRGESRRPSTRGSDGAERRGPYLLCRPPAGHAKLRPRGPAGATWRSARWQRTAWRPPARAAMGSWNRGAPPATPPPRQVQVNQELSRQLLQDGYRLDEVPDDEDLDLIPPKPAAAPCPWCFGDSLCCVLQ